ncbi:unnamed protein product [Rotaria sordida]|uniref:Uncharacterized protein n=1 Tax=Rotaria sordida TaxID=392033 RepID=A0A814XCV5_9BILA|nr:unnamed protein product [Rotaria sordida]CAF1492696.1 unnamed protein product [Rotaria sordida]
MITPNEFLQFANEMGLGRIKSTSPSPSPLISHNNNNNCTTTGLSVLNNLCHLIEEIHQLKTENNRLRAHLELVNHVELFQQRFVVNDTNENKQEKNESIISSPSIHDEEKFEALSPTSSLKSKSSPSIRERKGIHFFNNQEDSSLISHINHDRSEQTDSNIGLSSISNRQNWSKVRHVFKFSLLRKYGSPSSSLITNVERNIPAINISLESEEDHLQEHKHSLKKKKTVTTTNDNRQMIMGDETDQEDESTQFNRSYHTRRPNETDRLNSSSLERQEILSTSSPCNATNIDDEGLLTRKPSKIARYRRKLRSKLDTVKRQFSDQNSSSSSLRLFNTSHVSVFDDIGSGVNRALLTAQLAPALTKSYQQKMREWESMQKSRFLVNYRRQSIVPKIDFINNSRKVSIAPIIKKISQDRITLPSTIENCSSLINELNLETQTNSIILSPILSPNQRSLILHQWREIIKKMNLLKELETNLKTLKTNIFCTNYNTIKQQSKINIQDYDAYKKLYLPQRCRSLQSLVSMPASWVLAVQSAAYSDVLDGTSKKTNERAILFNKDFFDQLEQFKKERFKFEQDSVKELQSLNPSLTNQNPITNTIRSTKPSVKLIRTCGSLRKLSLVSYSQFPQYFLPGPVLPLQTVIQSKEESTSIIEPISTTTINEIDSNNKLSTDNFNKESKRSRFQLKETFQRNKSMCVNHFQTWFQRRQHPHSCKIRRKSIIKSKDETSCLTPIFHSPRLFRLHERIFKHQSQPLQQIVHISKPLETLDDSDNQSQYELPVRIYFPPLTTPIPRHVRNTHIDIVKSTNDNHDMNIEQTFNHSITSITNRKDSFSFQLTTAKKRRESFVTLSNIINSRCL